jgi:hypothetical protein
MRRHDFGRCQPSLTEHRISLAKQLVKTPVYHGTPHLQKKVRAIRGPAHRLMLAHSPVDQMIHSGLGSVDHPVR